MKRTDISKIGEFNLIAKLTDGFSTKGKNTIRGIGDDAAVIKTGDDCMVVTNDLLLEGVHFDLSYMPLKHLGYKAIAVNVSDVVAMNAIPEQVVVSIGISNRFSVEAVEELYEGIKTACENYKVDLVGGDTTASRAGLHISVTAMGRAEPALLSYRSGAKKGDILCVTGDLGGAYLGLQVLEREKQVFLDNPNMQPKLDEFEYVVKRQLRPEARADFVHELRELEIVPTSMIDVSDGLASEVLHLCKASGLGAVLYEEKIPIDKEAYRVALDTFKISPVTCALNGGEDYELLFTISQDDFKKVELHDDISFIGYMAEQEKGTVLATRAGQVVPITAQGWQHFETGKSDKGEA